MRLFSLLGLLVLAVVIYETTAQPALSVLPLCLKAGWEEFLTARWLRRRDPHRERGLAYSWFFLGSGLSRTASLAVTVTVMLGVILDFQQRRGRVDIPDEFAVALLVMFAGFGLAALATLYGCRVAWRSGVRVWLEAGWHRARQQDSWPPFVELGGSNTAGRLIGATTCLAYVMLVLVPLMLGGIFVLLTIFPPDQGNDVGFIVTAFGVVFFLVAGVPSIKLLTTLQSCLERRLVAISPAEAWLLTPST